MTETAGLPVHDSLHVLDYENIYKQEEWWKSVVRYRFDETDDHEEVAVYLWHKDGEWKRKNKYVIKTPEAWTTDRTIVDTLFADPEAVQPTETFPTSDYYVVATGETVFQSEEWWKAIVKIQQKGPYETEEVMVYLWQATDGDWRRRQKYTIKSQSQWEEEAAIIESVLEINPQTQEEPESAGDSTTSDDETTIPPEFEQLSREIDSHLSGEMTE